MTQVSFNLKSAFIEILEKTNLGAQYPEHRLTYFFKSGSFHVRGFFFGAMGLL